MWNKLNLMWLLKLSQQDKARQVNGRCILLTLIICCLCSIVYIQTFTRSLHIPQIMDHYENETLHVNPRLKIYVDLMKLDSLKFLPGIKKSVLVGRKRHAMSTVFLPRRVPKCGTTDIYHKLTIHPDFVAPALKEMHWLTRGRFVGTSLVQYLWHFSRAATLIGYLYKIRHRRINSVIIGDLSASTIWDNDFWPVVQENSPSTSNEPKVTNVDFLLHFNPNVKVIAMLRNPVDRLYSDHLYFSLTNKSTMDFHRKVVHILNIYRKCMQERAPRSCVYDRNISLQSGCRLRIGLYYTYISDFLKKMPRNNALFLRLKDHAERPEKTMETVFQFLGLATQNDTLQRAAKEEISNRHRDSDVSI